MNAPSTDPMLRQLRRLSPVEPDGVHSASVRARCHAALRRGRRAEIRRDTNAPPGRAYEVALVGGFALVYLLLVIFDALSVYGVV